VTVPLQPVFKPAVPTQSAPATGEGADNDVPDTGNQ